MPLPLAVFDTSVFINIHHLDLLSSLSLFFREVLVPAPVREEFLRRNDQRSREVALNVLTKRGLFSPCDDFDSVDVGLLLRISKDLHRAEAEALSQCNRRDADVLLIDEKIGRDIASKRNRKVEGTASILAKLHKLGIVDYDTAINQLKKDLKMRISDRIIREAFEKEA